VLLGPFMDYANLSIQFGYATMFIVAYPLAMVMSFVSNYVGEYPVVRCCMCAGCVVLLKAGTKLAV
jgi:hypothetical protein